MNPLGDLELQLRTDARSLRGLARDLVGDLDVVDDLVQEAVQRTLQRPPEQSGGLGAWLQTVLRNLCFQHRRQQRRRLARERVAARPERTEPTIDVAERRETLRAVTTAVFGLEEPYQGVILLRYFEDLSPTAIAARTGVNLATVKSRLQRGLILLRARIDAASGERNWQRALVATVGLKPLLTTTLMTTGVLLMGPTAKIAFGTAAVAACAALIWTLTADSARLVPTASANAPAPTAASAQTAQPTPKLEEQRVAVPTEEPIAPSLVHPYAFDLQVEVIDRDGLPVNGAQIHLAPIGCTLDKLNETTGVDGIAHAHWRGKQESMEMALLVDGQPTMRRLFVQAGAPQRVVAGGSARGNKGTFTVNFLRASATNELAVASRAYNNRKAAREKSDLALALGTLLDTRATASELTMQAGLHPHALFGDALVAAPKKENLAADFHEQLVWAAVKGERLTAYKLRLDTSNSVRDAESTDGGPPPTVLEGAVYDDQGRAVAGATVCWGEDIDRPADRTTTDDEGRFHFDNVKPGHLELRAGGRDNGLVHERVFVAKEKITHWDARLVKEAVIRGRAVDAAGKPLEGWVVEIAGAQRPWFDACDVQKDGSFVLPNQPGGVGRLLLRHRNTNIKLPVAVVGDVLPDSGELLVKFDAATASGQLSIEPVVPDGLQGVQAEVRVWQEETGRGASMDRAEDSPVYSLAGLPAGSYRVEVGASSIGWVDAGRHWVDGKGPVQIGKFALPQPGRVRISYPEGSVPQGEKFEQQICLRRPGCDIRVEDAATAKGAELTLPAGDYWLLWRDVDGRRQVLGFSVAAGKETAVDAGAVSSGR